MVVHLLKVCSVNLCVGSRLAVACFPTPNSHPLSWSQFAPSPRFCGEHPQGSAHTRFLLGSITSRVLETTKTRFAESKTGGGASSSFFCGTAEDPCAADVSAASCLETSSAIACLTSGESWTLAGPSDVPGGWFIALEPLSVLMSCRATPPLPLHLPGLLATWRDSDKLRCRHHDSRSGLGRGAPVPVSHAGIEVY
jgi:hypothetical protein